jgi:hypothetical protein
MTARRVARKVLAGKGAAAAVRRQDCGAVGRRVAQKRR